MDALKTEQARKLQATLVRNYEPLTHLLTGKKNRATSVARNMSADYDESVIAEYHKLYLWTYTDMHCLTALHLLEQKADKSWYRLICVQHCTKCKYLL